MSVVTKRNRSIAGATVTLDLTSASAAARRFEVMPDDLGRPGSRFFGFTWRKSTTQPVTIQVVRVDEATSTEVVLAEYDDVGGLSGTVAPRVPVHVGREQKVPDGDHGTTYRLQFSQTAGACLVTPFADYQEA